MKKRLLCAGLAAAMAVSLTACGGSAAGTKAEGSSASAEANSEGGSEAAKVFKIGGIGPVTGGAAVYGMAVQHGTELAVNEINAAGGINGYQIEFQFQDDEHDAEKSVNAYNTLKDWGMQVLVGTTTSAPCLAVADKTAADNMFQITPSGSVVECAANPNVIYDSSDVYSSGVYEKFAQEAPAQGIEIVAAEAFTADSNKDFSTQLQKAKDAGAEMVFLPIYYTEASLILQQANTMGFAPQFFGVDGMDGILQVEGFDTSLAEGLMLLTPFAADAKDDLTVKFVKAYEDAYKETPIQFAADAYDAVYAVKAAIEDAKATPDMSVSDLCEAMKASMLNIKLDGLTGTGMTWTEDGEPHKAPKAVKIVDGAYAAME